MSTQTPLGTDFDTVHVQFEAQQTFWKELVEQQPKIESVIALGNRLANESHWPQGTGEELRSQFAGVDGRWRKISTEGEEWGKLLESVHPEMEVFQVREDLTPTPHTHTHIHSYSHTHTFTRTHTHTHSLVLTHTHTHTFTRTHTHTHTHIHSYSHTHTRSNNSLSLRAQKYIQRKRSRCNS